MDFSRVFLKNPIYEKLYRYTLNKDEAFKIDPNPALYFFSGPEEAEILDAALYYVVQVRKENVQNSELLDMAVELQKEALWSRLKLKDSLYVRRFFEDNSFVTQLWRPVIISDT